LSHISFHTDLWLFNELINDLILRLAEEHLYAPYWSQQILDELRRDLQLRIGEERSAQRINAMTAAFPKALVTGYESLIKNMTCDEKDRHVLAAADYLPHKPWSPSTRKIFLKLRHSLFASK
jgi:predicted nucleic acid-binding protein